MKYRLYTTSETAWDAMLEAIDQASKSIYMEMYIFANDTVLSHDFIGKLKQKAAEGVSVVIVADAFGSSALRKEAAGIIKQSSIELIFFSHWLRHIHRKILIVDEKTAFIGGVNIGKSYRYWNDLQLRLSGKIIRTLLKSFAYTYAMSGGKNRKILNYREIKYSGKLKHWFLEHWPIKNIYTLKSLYVEKINQARKSIQIVTPYFTPPRWLISVLDNAVRRNVAVEILLPRKTDFPLLDRLNYRYAYEVHPLGAKFFLTKTMNHAKLLVIDGEEGLIGSQNIDLLSFKINTEAGIFFKERKLLKEISAVIESWKKDSVEFELEQYKMKFIDYIILALMKIFRPIL